MPVHRSSPCRSSAALDALAAGHFSEQTTSFLMRITYISDVTTRGHSTLSPGWEWTREHHLGENWSPAKMDAAID